MQVHPFLILLYITHWSGPSVWEGRAPESVPVKSLVGLRDKKEHSRRRKPWIRALSPASIKYYESFLTSRTTQLVELLEEKASEVVDLSKWIGYYT